MAYALTIACPTIAVTPASVPDATVGASYSQSFAASGGNAPYAWTITSGSMDGLIDSAKRKLWAFVNELARVEPTPTLRVGLCGRCESI